LGTAEPSPGEPSLDVEAPAPPVPAGVEAIEVTGERLDATDIQDEAHAITAFSGEDLDRANIVNIDSLQFNVPGLHVGQTGQQAIVTLRGVGTENASITGEPGVAFHVDGVNYAQPSAARVAFFDLESLDIRRGPQGLKGGKNSTSGTINVVTRKPHDEYEVSGDLLMGNYDRRRARGAVNIPLGELLALRTAVFYEDRDGFLDNLARSDNRDAFDSDDFGFRTHVRLTPSDTLEALFTYNYFQQGGVGPQSDIAPIPRTYLCDGRPPGVDSSLPAAAVCTVPRATEDADPRFIYLNFPSSQDTQFWGWTGTIGWDVPALPLLGETRLEGIGGFQQSEIDFRQDFDATDKRFTELDSVQKVKQHTAELQWTGTLGGERLEWQAGGYYARERGGRFLEVPNLLFRDLGLAEDYPLEIDQQTENIALGASLHGLLHLTDTARFELGGRWIRDEKRTKLFRSERTGATATDTREAFIGCNGSLGYVAAGGAHPEESPPWCTEPFRAVMWGSGLDWRPFGADHLLYAKLDRGHKSGGFRSGQRGNYLPEGIWAYAVGSKSELFDSRLQLNLEGFVYSYQDMQLVILDGTTLRTENADTRMYGWDLEAKASPIEGLELGAIVSFLKTEVREYHSIDPADLAAFQGDAKGARPDQIEAFNLKRLQQRDTAENLTAKGTPRTFETTRGCYASPPNRIGQEGAMEAGGVREAHRVGGLLDRAPLVPQESLRDLRERIALEGRDRR
jgi:iron complex outermembrane receptor protein